MDISVQALVQQAASRIAQAELTLFKAGAVLEALVLGQTAAGLTETQTSLAATQQHLARTTATRDALDREVTGMRAALTWRLTAPFRALRRLFS